VLLGACNALSADLKSVLTLNGLKDFFIWLVSIDIRETFHNCAAITKIYSNKKLSADKREILLSSEGSYICLFLKPI